MKRLFTIVICLTLSQITQAHRLFDVQIAQLGRITAAAGGDTILSPVINPIALTAYQHTFKRRLDSVQREVQLDYNSIVQGYIETYMSSGRKNDIGRMLGLAKYYFPIYEKAFREAGIPEEIKFLSIVESELNPFAVSRVGATGPWQFMYATGKAYGLNVDDYVDERRDPIKASYAAAAYLRDAYQEFGDWLLAIASYNCGKSSVERAIDKAGATDFWSIRPYLPQETRGYVPAFIAVAYMMNYPGKHSITPQVANFNIKTDTILVSKMVSLNNLARALELDAREVSLLNPAYKRGIVNGSTAAPRRLIIPQIVAGKYATLYDLLNTDGPVAAAQPVYASAPVAPAGNTPVKRPAFHKVRRGETLADVADQYDVDIQDLKAWNNLHSSRVATGKRLKLSENITAAADEDTHATKKADKKYLTYKVRKGDTLIALAEKFEASVDSIKELNGLKKNALQPGMMLRITKV